MSTARAIVPLERYYRAAEVLSVVATARRLALLDVLAAEGGPLPLGVAIYRAGMATQGSLCDAAELEAAGIVTVKRPTGRCLSEIVQITADGLRALEMARTWADDG